MTGDESIQYSDRGSSIGDATIEQLRSEITDWAQRFDTTSRLEVFGGIRLLRDRIFGFLDTPGRTGTTPNRDLHFLAAAACGMLGNVTNDLGHPSAAGSHFRAALMLAEEAGSPTLTAWLRGEQATAAYWNGLYAQASQFARAGQDLHPDGTCAVFLPALEARAAGELGDQPAARAAIHRATDTRTRIRPGELDQYGGFLAFNQARQHFYAAGAYLGLGDHPHVVTEATASLDAYQMCPPEERSFINEALARFQAATANVKDGDLDAAEPHTRAALNVAPELRTSTTEAAAQRLYRHLCEQRVRDSQLATDTREQIEDFLSVSAGRFELM